MEIQRYNEDIQQQLNSSPEVGDVYVPKASTFSNDILKITSVEDNGKVFGCKRYNFISMNFVETDRNRISLKDLKEYYRKALHDFDSTVNTVVFDGQQSLLEQTDSQLLLKQSDSQSNELTTANKKLKEELITYSHKMEILANQAEEIQIVLKCYVEHKKSLLNEQLKSFNNQLSQYKSKIREINQMISMIELYCGIEEEVRTITTGEVASVDTKISIRQKILFMDEECAVSGVYGHLKDGFDYNNIDDFCCWLKDSHNRDQVIPEQKAIVVLKPRRYNKDYRNPYDNEVLNRYNRESYILIRNGENLYLIFTENFYIYDTVFPSKDIAAKLFEKISTQDFNKKFEEIDYRSILERARTFAIFIQGVLDRTTLLHPIKENSNYFTGNANVEFIYDDDNILSDGRLRYKEWIKEINKEIKVGSRIVFNEQQFLTDYGSTTDYYEECFKKYYREFPNIPEDGIYEVSEIITDKYYGERICFKYKPGGQYWSFTEGYKERTTAVTFCTRRNDDWIINYDQLELNDVDYYLNSRIDRPSYNNFIPLLKTVRQQLVKEQQSEQLFIDLIMNNLKLDNKQIALDCITWWKYKNKIKRSIDKDDTLAYKMITTKIKTLIKKK